MILITTLTIDHLHIEGGLCERLNLVVEGGTAATDPLQLAAKLASDLPTDDLVDDGRVKASGQPSRFVVYK